ncbi:MAG: ThiF family adenylyltransferase [Pyrinomonadaceae bacterium]
MKVERKTNNDIANVEDETGDEAERFPEFPRELLRAENPIEVFYSKEREEQPDEPNLYARHEDIPAHNQMALEQARIVLVGGGGLNSWAGVGLARSGARSITVIDHDRVDLTNLSRQFFSSEDLGQLKGIALAKNLAGQSARGSSITGIGLRFEDALADYPLPADIFVAGVDNNECRLQVVREARRRSVPAVFTMLSRDGMRCQAFLQNASPLEPCLWCALPNLDPKNIMWCASAIISSCFMASAYTVFFAHRALMGWGKLPEFNWRESDLTGTTSERTGVVKRRTDCTVCSKL